MELPKNITQVGESDQYCKVYAEDYVISYIKQINRQAEGKSMAVALYGIRKEEENISYIFFYGAAKVNSIQKEVRHLSQAQNQEVDKLRKRFFPDYQFMGYRLLDGDMVDGFYICDQGTCRYILGYACFYEKNDAMLAYMLDSRKENVPPENVDQEKFDRVRQRQEERRAQYRSSVTNSTNRSNSDRDSTENVHEESRERKHEPARQKRRSLPENPAGKATPSLRMMRTAVAGMFVLLCILGIASLNNLGSAANIQTAARQLIAEFSEQKIPDASQEAESSGQSDTLVAEDKLTDAIQQENAAKQSDSARTEQQTEQPAGSEAEQKPEQPASTETERQTDQSDGSQSGQQANQSDSSQSGQQTGQSDNSGAKQQTEQPDAGQTGGEQTAQQTSSEPEPSEQASAPVTYTIKKGDTLTSISIRQYGTDEMVQEICNLNQIKDPDDIRFGQKILLP